MSEKSIFPIKTWIVTPPIFPSKDQLLSAIFPNKPSSTPEYILAIPDKTQDLDYLFSFQTFEKLPNFNEFNSKMPDSGFCILFLYNGSNKSTFESIKSLFSQINIPAFLQKKGFLMLLDLKIFDDSDEKMIPSSQAETFASENGMFFLEVTVGSQRKNIELLQKIMRIRASHLQKDSMIDFDDQIINNVTLKEQSQSNGNLVKDQREFKSQFDEINEKERREFKNQRKPPIDLNPPDQHSYDLPLKTPQFTKDFTLLSKDKLKAQAENNSQRNNHLKPITSFSNEEVRSSQKSLSNANNGNNQVSSLGNITKSKLISSSGFENAENKYFNKCYDESENKNNSNNNLKSFKSSYTELNVIKNNENSPFSTTLTKNYNKNQNGLKEFVVKNENLIPVFETSISERTPNKSRILANSNQNSNSNSNNRKNKKKAQSRSIYEASKENIRDLGTIEIELEDGIIGRVPLFVEDTSFSITERLMKLVGQQWAVPKVKKMALLIEKYVNEHIEGMIESV